jgi:hypothetical protein
MKKQIVTLVMLFAAMNTYSQTAVDFTLTDCDSISRHLYAILEQPKVVALDYEHECGMCTAGTANLSTVIKTYYNGDTNIIVMYLDNGGNSCATTANWIATNNFVTGPYFEYSSDQSSPYGSGMPVIVIVAGSSHQIFLTANGAAAADTASIHNAIRDALASITGIADMSDSGNSFDVSPNPAGDKIVVTLNKKINSQKNILSIYDAMGRLISQQPLTREKNEIYINGLAKGVYIARYSDSRITGVAMFLKE